MVLLLGVPGGSVGHSFGRLYPPVAGLIPGLLLLLLLLLLLHISATCKCISGKWTYCHIEIEAADQTCCLTQSYTDSGPTSPSSHRCVVSTNQIYPKILHTVYSIFKSNSRKHTHHHHRLPTEVTTTLKVTNRQAEAPNCYSQSITCTTKMA